MILRALVIGLVLLTAAALETAVFPSLTLAGFRPNLLVLVVVGFALRDGPTTGVGIGFAAGLLSDLLVVQAPVGLGALVLTAIGYGVGLARPYLAPDSVTAPIILGSASAALATLSYGVLAILLGGEPVGPSLLLQATIAVALYDALLAPVVVGLTTRLTARFPPGRASLLE